MIPLSKIFKTNKISYILRESEEDDFTVDAPKGWDINDLEIGDTIVPNMWDLEKIEQAISQNNIAYPNWFAEPHTIESFTHSKDVVFTDGTKRSLYFLKLFLQPQYQIINVDPLSESDEFNIDAPEEWGVEPLTVGSTITPDMWDENQTQFNYSFITKQSWTIDEVNLVDDYEDNYWGCVLIGDENGEYWDDELVNVNGALKHPYKIITGLNESQDDFTVDVPKDWNIEELTVGNTITPDMWQDSVDEYWKSLKSNPLKIIGFNSDWEGPYVEFMSIEPDKINRFINIDLDEVNEDLLKPQYKVIMSLSESDEYNIDAPKGWNIGDLKVGDKLIPDMFQPNTNLYDWASSFDLTLKKIDFKNNKIIYILTYVNGETNTGKWNLDYFEKDLAPGYELKRPSLSESDDEFTVDVPEREGWDETELRVGHYFNMSMNPDFSGVWNNLEDVPKSIRHFIKQVIYIGPNVGQYKSPEYKGHVDIIAYNFPTDKDRKDRLYAISVEEFNKRWSKQMNASITNYLEESQDEFNVDAPQEWDEYDGNIIITYEIENEGEVYVPVADEEEFERLNPNIKINYSEEPIYVDIIYKSKSVNINEFIKELENYSEELLPFTGPKTTNNFKLWLGNNDYYLAYFYQFLNPTAIKKKYATDDRKPVRVTKKMEENIFWRQDEVGVTILNVRFIDNINESEDEYNIDVPPDWNKIELTVGSLITPDMYTDEAVERWNYGANQKMGSKTWGESVNYFWTKPQTIYKVYPTYDGNNDLRLKNGLILSSSDLKDQYLIVSNMLESEDEYNIDVPPDWNKIELTVGSAIEPNMWKKTEIANYNPNTNEIEGVKFSQTVYILEVGKDSEGKYVVLNKNNDFDGFETWWDLDTLNDNLEEPYKIISNLTESKDEFTVDAPQDWSVIELKVGDTITPDMWERDNFIQETVTIADIWYEPETEEDYGGYIVRLNFPYGRIYDLDLDILNDNLKHPYQIFSPLNESDEFNVDVPQGWNIKELGIGDILNNTNMEISDVDISYKIVDFKKNEYGSDLVGLIKYTIDEDGERKQWNIVPSYWYVSMANKKLKPGYEIVVPEPLKESDDDFTVDAPKEWGIEGLTVGDFLDPSNLKMQNFRKKYEILGFTQRPWGNDVRLGVYELVEEPISGTRRTSKQWKQVKVYSADLNGLNDLLKDGYKIVTPESLRESNDDFNVTPDKIWNELDIGDIVLNKNLSSTFYQFKNVPFEIVNEINLGDEEYWWVEPYKNKDKEKLKKIINTLTNNKWEKETYGMWVMKKNVEPYQGSLNENNDDDFTVDAPKNWNLNYEQPINITISYEEEVRDKMGKYGVLLKSYFTQTNLTELEQVAGYNFTYDELTPHNVQRFITNDQDLLIEIEDMASDSNIETIESDNGFDFDDYKSIDINNFYVDVEFPVA